jgi:hypothetical protein
MDFFFRLASDDDYRIYVDSHEKWTLAFGRRVGAEFISDILASGEIDNLDISTNGQNRLRLIVFEETAYFFVNDNYVSTLLVPTIRDGDVAVGTGFYKPTGNISDDEMVGASTPYKGFVVWKIH